MKVNIDRPIVKGLNKFKTREGTEKWRWIGWLVFVNMVGSVSPL